MTTFRITGTALCLAAMTLLTPSAAMAGPPAAETIEVNLTGPPSMQEAMGLQNAGRWDEAAEAWAQIVEAQPDNGAAIFNLGYCLHAGGHLEEALEFHYRASEFDDFRGIALYNVGCANALLGNRDGALGALQASREAGFDISAARDDSDFDSMRDDVRLDMMLGGSGPEGWGGGMSAPRGVGERLMMAVGRARDMLHEYSPEAEQRVQGMLQQFAMQAQQRLGQFMQDERYAGMFAAVQEFVQDERVQRGLQSLAQDERFAPIAMQLQRFMGGGPGAGEMRPMEGGNVTSRPAGVPTIQQAERLRNNGNWDAAIGAYQAIIAADPQNAQAHFGMAYCIHMAGDYETAIAAHKRAAEFDGVRGISLYNLGCAYALTGQHAKAFAALRTAHQAGFDVLESMDGDSDLDSLRDHDAFDELIMELSGDL